MEQLKDVEVVEEVGVELLKDVVKEVEVGMIEAPGVWLMRKF